MYAKVELKLVVGAVGIAETPVFITPVIIRVRYSLMKEQTWLVIISAVSCICASVAGVYRSARAAARRTAPLLMILT